MKARKDTDLYGADISSYQSITNPTQFFTDFDFVYFRAYGSDHTGDGDTKFIDFVKLAKQYNVPSGGYYFATPDPTKAANAADLKADAEAQAAQFITKLQAAYGTGRYGDLVPMLDIEAYEGNKYDPTKILLESELKENALALTSLFETSTDSPDNFGVTAGNFDGAGLSHGAIQFNFKSGTLQPIWRDLLNNHPTVVQGAITNSADYDYFRNLILNGTTADQIAFGDNISDPANKHKVVEPWNTYFKNLGVTQESIDRQIVAAQWYYDQAKKYFDTFDLWTRRGYALMFDIAVQSGSISQAVIDLINADFAAMDNTGKTPEQIETDKLVIIANRRADAVTTEWQQSYRERKLSIANGSGWVYGGTLFMDTANYNMILEPAYQERIWGYPYAGGMTGTQLKDWILAFRTYFRATTGNRAVGLYTNRSFLTETGQMGMTAADLSELDIMPLWLAEWNETEGYVPPTLGEWYNYALWQYGMIADASAHGVSHSQNQLDHNVTQELALIMPPKAPTNITLTQLTNTTVQVDFTPPGDTDYIGSDIYLNGQWAAWVNKGTNTKTLTVTTPIGSQLQINVVSQDNYQDTAWSANTYFTLVDLTPAPVVPDQTINFLNRAAGDNTRKIMVNGLAGTELTPTQFGAEWWNYPAIAADDGTLMTYTISPNNGANNGDKIQYLFQFEVTDDPTPAEKLVFRIKGVANQPFTLKFWDHIAAAWDETSKVTFSGSAGYIEITSTNPFRHIGPDNRVYISMLSTNSTVDPALAYTSRKYNVTDNAAWRSTTGAYMGDADKTIYTGGSSGLTSYLWTNLLTDIKNSLNTSRGTPTAFININTTTAGLARLGFHKLATNPKTTVAPIPAYDQTNPNLSMSLVVGWNRWDISNAAVGGQTGIKNVLNNGGYLGPVLYALTTDGSTSFSNGSNQGSNAPNIEVVGDWQATSGVTLGADYAELQIFRAEPLPPPVPKPEPVGMPPEQLTYEYTQKDIDDMLHGKTGSRLVRFRFDLLDMNENKIRELHNVESADVSMNSFNTIKRTARFVIRDTPDEPIDYLTHRIQPFAEFKLPDKFVQNADGTRVLLAGKWIEFPLGVFLLSSPKRVERGTQTFRDIEAYDGIVILEEDKFTSRYHVPAGTKYTDAIIDILVNAGITKYNIDFSDRTLPNDVEYEPGTEKTKPISDFLTAINFTALWVDDYGYFTAQKYISPADRDPDYRYEENEFSVITNGVEEELDLYSVPNKWVAVHASADSTSNVLSMMASYTNTDPNSPTSTVNRGRTIVDYRKVEEIADQAALSEYVERIAFEASQIFGKVRFQTAIMPFHGFQDVLYLKNETLGIDGKYAETGWKFALKPGALMEHEVRAVIQI
jgi:hypothetical protein